MNIPLLRIHVSLRHSSFTSAFRAPTASRQTFTTLRPRSAATTTTTMASSQHAQPGSRSYAEALALLNTLQSNRAITKLVGDSTDRNAAAIPEMLDWVRRAGFRMDDFNKLRVIHVAGTKGKGSVCATISSILSQYQVTETGRKLGKIGIYTSPHLTSVRERIGIDGKPIDQELFAKYFFDLWDRFTNSAKAEGHADPAGSSTKPFYFRYLTIMALHLFLREGVETAIVECGIGGEYDSTNVLTPESVSVSAITALGIDHTAMLGHTVDKIAWHKAGIFKPGVPAFTTIQEKPAAEVLEQRAKEKNVPLTTVPRHPDLESDKVELGLKGDFQKDNSSLAAAVCGQHLRNLGFEEIPKTQDLLNGPLPEKFAKGLETAHWDGRCQIERENNIEWYIDGAHTRESIEATARWFASRPDAEAARTMLIFNQQERDATALLSHLHRTLGEVTNRDAKSAFNYVAASTNRTFAAGSENEDTSVQQGVYSFYDDYAVQDRYVCTSIEEAANKARAIAAEKPNEKLQVLVTGSLYLVGGFLGVLRGETEEP